MKPTEQQFQLVQQARLIASERGADSGSRLEEELRVHAIELELQNEELQDSRARLETSQDEFRRLFELAPVAYLAVDDRGEIVRANRAAHRLLGARQLLHEYLVRLVRSHHIKECERLLATQGEEPLSIELEFSRGGKTDSWTAQAQAVRLKLETDCVLVCLQDVTDLRRAVQRARDSENGLRGLIEVSPDAIAVVQGGRIVLANSALRELVGTADSQVIGSELVQYIRADEKQQLVDALDVAMLRDGAGYLQVHLHGSQRSIEMRFARLSFEGSVCVLAVARDITERMRVAAEMEQSSRLTSLGMLVAGVAHEINNPLTFVLPNLSQAEERLLDAGTVNHATVVELIREARHGVERVADIVKDLKVFHRVNESLEPVDFNQIAADTLRMAAPKLRHLVKVSRDLGALPRIRGNAGRLGQVVLNLLLNASQAMPPDRPSDKNHVSLRTWSSADDVLLEVQDNGVGIPASDLKRLFDPFFSQKSGGTGLGLTVCASLVREMGGWIEVDSQVNRGTRFVLRFPVCKEEPLDSDKAERQRPGLAEGLRILVVDDEPLIYRTIRRTLGEKFALHYARSGRQAIELLKGGLEVDVVVTDLVMPDGTGLELYQWLGQWPGELQNRLVFMTGMAHPETLGDLPELPQVPKPFSIAQIESAISSLF